MNEYWKKDEHIKPTGQWGNGNYRAYDEKTGRNGYVNSYGNFIPDKPKEEPQPSSDTGNFQSAGYTNSYTDNISYSNASGSSFIEILGGAFRAIGTVVLGVGIFSYFSARKDNPDPDAAMKKAVRNGSCAAGIIGVFIIMVISALIWFIGRDPASSGIHFGDVVIAIIETICLCILIGLIRIMMDRRFFPQINVSSVKESLKNTRIEIKFTRTTSLIIIIASAYLLFKPTFTLLGTLAILILGDHTIASLPWILVILFQLIVALLSGAADLAVGFFISRLLSAIFSKFSKNS